MAEENKWASYKEMFDSVESISAKLDDLVNNGAIEFSQAAQALRMVEDAKKAPIAHVRDLAKMQLNNLLTQSMAMERSGARDMGKLRTYLDNTPGASPDDYIQEQTKVGSRALYKDWGLTDDQLRMYGQALGI